MTKDRDDSTMDERTDSGIDTAGLPVPVRTWEDLESLLHQLVLASAQPDKPQRPAQLELLGDIFRSAMKLAQDTPGTLNLKIAATTLRELRYSFKTFAKDRDKPKITIFGSARVPEGDPVYNLAKEFARLAVKRKFMIITGGGPGIMQAGNEGAETAGGFGLNIRLPFEQSANPFIDPKTRLVHYKYFFIRKLFLVKEAAAVALFPGGFGTFDEGFELLTLLQTGKTNLVPLVLVEPKGYGFWEGFRKFLEEIVLKRRFISESDFSLMRIAHSPEEAMDEIATFYRVFHSMRFVKKMLVLRLKKPLSEATLADIGKKFQSLTQGEGFQQVSALPEEANEPELAGLSRLVFPWDRKDMGALRRLVDHINAAV
jgi:uncharacterized protein (TIGR00730 family)